MNRRNKLSKEKKGESQHPPSSQASSSAHQLSSNHDNSQPLPTSKSSSGTSTPATDSGDEIKLNGSSARAKPPRKIILERNRRPSLSGKHSYNVRAPGTPWHELDLSEVDFLKHHVEIDSPPLKRGFIKYRRIFFIVGAILGAVLAALVSRNVEMAEHMATLRNLVDEQIDGLGIDMPSLDLGLPKEFAELGDNLFSRSREWFKNKDFHTGRTLFADGYRAEHPVILLPGIISTGLESWTTDPESSGYFRKRLWGTTTMMRTIVFEKDMWVKHLSLDTETGLDPPGIRVRAAEGLDAASFFAAGFWIWSKVIENLAVLGYDTNNLFLASYDWRLSFHNLEVRDKFFTRLKLKFEQNLHIYGKKTVMVSHSMGSSVFFYFLKWVEAEGEGMGNGGPDWVENHVEAFTSIAGTLLGVPKAMAALLSGEMRDTVEVPPAAAYLLEKFFSRKERAKLFRSWAGSASMMIKGGESVWGNSTWAPDDEPGAEDTHGHLYSFREPGTDQESLDEKSVKSNLTAQDAHLWLLEHTPSSFQKMIATNYSNGIEKDAEQLQRNNQDPTKWSNPLEAPLPHAPSMKIYCIYGHGKPTERSYWYQQGPYEQDDRLMDGKYPQCTDCENVTHVKPLDFPTGRTSWIDSTIHKEDAVPKVRAGCKMGEGDGTVSLLSLGAMCAQGWKLDRYNPA
ncbi:LACT-domain-containing protein, partial [Violaceomyces palustris]